MPGLATSPPPDARQKPRGRRVATAVATAVVASVLGGNAAVLVARWTVPRWAHDLDRLAPLVIAVVYLCVIAALLMVTGRTRAQRRDLLALRPTDQAAFGRGIAVWAGAYAAAAGLYGVIGLIGGSTLGDAVAVLLSVGADNGRLSDASPVLVGIIVARIILLSPIAEELFFRGVLFTWLRTRMSARATILLTGVVFGLIHQSPTFIPLAILVGVAAGWIRERSGSVVVTIGVHALQSTVVVLASLAATGWDTAALLG